MMTRRHHLVLLTALAVLATGGCGDDGRVEVGGVVRLQGEPLPHAFLRFERNGETVAHGTTGRFQLRQPDGGYRIAPGSYQVVVDFRPPEPGPNGAGELDQTTAAWQAHLRSTPGETSRTVTIDATSPALIIDLDETNRNEPSTGT